MIVGHKMIPTTAFYFLRHGQTDFSKEHRVQGSLDIPLNADGRHEALLAVQVFRNCNIKTIVTSPLIRASETAQIIGDQCKLTPVILDDIKEVCAGTAEGQIKPKNFAFLEYQPTNFFIGAEPLDVFRTRVLRGMCTALALPAPVCIVAHGGVFRILCQNLGLAVENAVIPPATVIRFTPINGSWQLERF